MGRNDHELLKSVKFTVEIKTDQRHIKLEFTSKEALDQFLDEPDIRSLLDDE